MVLYMKIHGGPFGSQSNLSPDFVICGGISFALGQTLSMNPISLPLPMFFFADKQKTGNRSWLIIAFFSPIFISSSSSSPLSKYFSIRPSSFSAMASINSLCSRSAFSFSESGIGSFLGFPPSGGNWYIVIRSTSMIALNSSPWFNGYWTTTTFLPKCSFACATVLSKSALSWSILFTAKIMGVRNFSVYSQIMSLPTSTPKLAFNNITPVSATRSAESTSPTKSS